MGPMNLTTDQMDAAAAVIILSPFHKRGNQGSEHLPNLPEATLLGSKSGKSADCKPDLFYDPRPLDHEKPGEGKLCCPPLPPGRGGNFYSPL